MRVTANFNEVFVLGGETGGGVSSLRYCTPVEQPRSPTWGNLCNTGNVEWSWEAIPRELSPVILSTQKNEHRHTPMRISTGRAPICPLSVIDSSR